MNWNVLVLCVNPVGFPQCQWVSRGRCLLGAKRVLSSLFCFWARLPYKYKKKLLLSCFEIVYPNAFFQAAGNKKCHTSAASFLNYSVSSFISVNNPDVNEIPSSRKISSSFIYIRIAFGISLSLIQYACISGLINLSTSFNRIPKNISYKTQLKSEGELNEYCNQMYNYYYIIADTSYICVFFQNTYRARFTTN